jgi:pseudooxynicotine dehydrogenase
MNNVQNPHDNFIAVMPDDDACGRNRFIALERTRVREGFADGSRVHLRSRGGLALVRFPQDARARIQLSTTVVRVRQEPGHVSVYGASSQVFKARAAIITVPMNTLGRIEFLPALSDAKRAAAKEKHANRSTKFWYKLKQRIGLWEGLAPWPNPVSLTFTEEDEPDGTVLVAFGPPSTVNVNDIASVQKAVRTLIPEAQVTRTAGHDWSSDRYSDGAWCWYKPNQMTKYLKALQTREGNCFFASADSANGWRGFIDGAIESGLRVAHDVLQTLRT